MLRTIARSIAFCCAAVAAANVSGPAHARANAGVVYGVRAEANGLVVRSLDLGTGRDPATHGRLRRQGEERLSSIFLSKDRSIGMLSTSTKKGPGRRALVRGLGHPQQVYDGSEWEALNLGSGQALSSVLVRQSGPPIALVSHYSDTPPYSLAILQMQPGRTVVVRTIALNPYARYAHLTQCPNGAIYATSLAPQWDPHVVTLNVERREVTLLKELKFNGRSLRNDVRDLACSPSGQLFALADPDYSGTNSL
jgi:hypothetical protein